MLEELKTVFDKPIITVREAARYLHKDPRTLMNPKYKFPYRKRGKRYLVSLVALSKWMAEQ